ncbi:hypothetical protein HK102_011551, partial [Quaeritorhiza haematococci]
MMTTKMSNTPSSLSSLLSLSALAAMASQVSAGISAYGSLAYNAGPQNNLNMQQMLNLLNQARSNVNAPSLVVDPRLYQAAEQHCHDMANTGRLEHNVVGTLPWDRAAAYGFEWASVGENLYYDDFGGDTNKCFEALFNSQ